MFEKERSTKKSMQICLLGASFETGNMGVSALAVSSVKVILNRWPSAQITLLSSGYTPGEQDLTINGKKICLRNIPIRFSKNVFLPYHFFCFVFYALMIKILPGLKLKEFFASRNEYFKILYESKYVADITGGDSFSDIYGFRRFFLGFLVKWLVVFSSKDLIMLPQTYGPFKRSVSRCMARYILKKAKVVYSRDKEGMECVKELLKEMHGEKIKLCPDIAFVLDPVKPKVIDIVDFNKYRTADSMVVGLNISGLLFNGGYTKNNMFGLKVDYPKLIHLTIEMLLKKEKTIILLIPHVFPPAGYEVESDPIACLEVYESLKDKYKGRIFLVKGEYNQNEIKHVIGTCDFFIGSRMHSCIAALSQCIPAVGLAYSSKFNGVFSSVGCNQFVVDMRRNDREEILSSMKQLYNRRKEIQEHLMTVIPQVRDEVLSVLEE